MPGHIPIKQPTKSEAQDAQRKLEIIAKETNCLTTTLRNYVYKHGPLELLDSRGKTIKYASVQQTEGSAPNVNLVIESLQEMYTETDPRAFATLHAMIEKLSVSAWPSFYKKLDKGMMGELSACVDARDPTGDGGWLPIYGAASFGNRKTKPVPGTHITVLPNEKPRTNEVG